MPHVSHTVVGRLLEHLSSVGHRAKNNAKKGGTSIEANGMIAYSSRRGRDTTPLVDTSTGSATFNLSSHPFLGILARMLQISLFARQRFLKDTRKTQIPQGLHDDVDSGDSSSGPWRRRRRRLRGS